MALINSDNLLFLGMTECIPRPYSYTKDIHDFTDTDYWYAEFFNEDSIQHLSNPNVISTEVLDKIRNKQCVLMLNNAHEAFHSVVRPLYEIAVLKLGLPPEQIVLISESAIINKEVEKIANEYNLGHIRTEWMRLFEHDTSVVEHEPLNTLEYKTYDKKFINFNRRWRLHRPALVALLELNGLLDKGHVSLSKADDGIDWNIFLTNITYDLRDRPDFTSIFAKNSERIKSIPPMTLDQSDMTINYGHSNYHGTKLTDSVDYYFMNSYFSVVTETNFFESTGEGLFVSEKIFRPILKKHPLIVVARPHTMKALRDISYKTYSPFINESYDNELDDCKRLHMIVDEINRLCYLSDNELHEFLTLAKEVAEFNYQTLINKQTFLTKL